MRNFSNYSAPKKLNSVLENYLDFGDARICRGFVLRIWKDKVCKVAGSRCWIDELDRGWISGQQADRGSNAYCHPELVIKMRSGSLWIPELHANCYRVQKLINERLGKDFLRSVRIK